MAQAGTGLRWVSTRGEATPVGLPTAVFRGLAPDGGLWVPEVLEPLPGELVGGLRGAPFQEVAARVLEHLLGRGPAAEGVADLVRDALDFPVPLVEVASDRRALELFHGPTLAFKDVGARFLAHYVARSLEREGGGGRPVTVLVATSGDTGGAVAHAFHGIPGTRVAVLFPRDRVSLRQERQFSTLGGNVRSLEVDGSFDECQRMAKEVFARPELSERYGLTSANSINPGRLLPQVTYYLHAWTRLPPGGEMVVSVPSGNFGNLAAGIMARDLGAPIRGFVAATNANDVVPQYLATGRLRPRPSVRTLSTAMDVGDPSNLERILHRYGRDLDAFRRDVVGSAHSDDETRRCIREVHHGHGHVLDPHGAVAWLGLERGMNRWPGARGVFLATAHPAKFAESVEPEIGREVPVPGGLAAALQRPRHVTPLEARAAALERFLEEW